MKKLSSSLTVLLAVGLFFSLCACETIVPRDQNEENTKITQESGAPTETAPIIPEETTAVTSEVMNSVECFRAASCRTDSTIINNHTSEDTYGYLYYY